MNSRFVTLVGLIASLCWIGGAWADEAGTASPEGATESESDKPTDKKPAEKPADKKRPATEKSPDRGPLMTTSLPKEFIQRVIRKNIKQVQFCYERSLVVSPRLAGKVVVKFTIGPTGAVTEASVGNSTLQDQKVEACILKAIRRWKFPSPKGGGIVDVSYPFVFKVNG
jgi:TonB family protein